MINGLPSAMLPLKKRPLEPEFSVDEEVIPIAGTNIVTKMDVPYATVPHPPASNMDFAYSTLPPPPASGRLTKEQRKELDAACRRDRDERKKQCEELGRKIKAAKKGMSREAANLLPTNISFEEYAALLKEWGC